jgi:hypothetical protein
MNEQAIKYITDVVKPWEQLNSALSKPYAIEPGISDFSRIASSLAVAIKHSAEINGLAIKVLEQESTPYKIMSDVADASKHGALRDASRNNTLTVSSMFEGNDEGKFRFLRNVVNINHATLGKIDFIESSKDASLYIMQKLNLQTHWTPIIYPGLKEFIDEVTLHASPVHQVSFNAFSLQFVKRNETGDLIPFDPPQWLFKLTSEF